MRTVDFHARVPAAVYGAYPDLREHPVVSAEFGPAGWVARSYRKRVSPSWARTLAGRGVTAVELSFDGRRADFSVAELARR